jgi:hypothetical protein
VAPGTGPVTLVSGLGLDLGALAVDDAHLYWVDQGGGSGGLVQTAPKTGGAATAIASNQSMPLDIAVDGTNVYWSLSQPLSATGGAFVCNAMFVAKGGGGAAPTCVTQTQYATLRMTLNDDDVVLLTEGPGMQLHVGFSAKGVALDPYKNTPPQGPTNAIAATDSNIFLSNVNGHHIDQLSVPALTFGPILCSDSCGTAAVVDMVLDGNVANLLWVTADGSLFRAPTAMNNQPTPLASLGAPPRRLARDASFVYATAENGSVYAVPLDGDAGAVITVASGEQAPFGIAADGTNVYWTTAGAIRSAPRPAR